MNINASARVQLGCQALAIAMGVQEAGDRDILDLSLIASVKYGL
jgi:hypothetical protein